MADSRSGKLDDEMTKLGLWCQRHLLETGTSHPSFSPFSVCCLIPKMRWSWAREQRVRHVDPLRLGRLEVDDQFKFRCFIGRNVLRVFALANVSDCDGEAAKHSIVCISHQSAALGECAKGVNRGQSPVPVRFAPARAVRWGRSLSPAWSSKRAG